MYWDSATLIKFCLCDLSYAFHFSPKAQAGLCLSKGVLFVSIMLFWLDRNRTDSRKNSWVNKAIQRKFYI